MLQLLSLYSIVISVPDLFVPKWFLHLSTKCVVFNECLCWQTCIKLLHSQNHWINADISHQTDSSGKLTLKWLPTCQIVVNKPNMLDFFTLTWSDRKSFQCGFSTGIRFMGNIHINSMIYFGECMSAVMSCMSAVIFVRVQLIMDIFNFSSLTILNI